MVFFYISVGENIITEFQFCSISQLISIAETELRQEMYSLIKTKQANEKWLSVLKSQSQF